MLNPSNFERRKVKYATKFFSKNTFRRTALRNPKLGLFKSANWAELSEFLKLARVKFKEIVRF